ncbi:MAG: hypothetical protein ACI8UO_000983 [Verrucomicrobiales bacterium]|jgi:hypothetical protein
MEIHTEDYEKLGSFYLGREYELSTKELQDDLLLFDSKDLVTHGVVLGMTGSGKTGLCMALLEEAALDKIPAIVIDPKGDIGNLLLQFPEFQTSDFRPWINEGDAAKKGRTPDEHAEKTAEMWKNGLTDWGQTGDRIRDLQSKVDVNIFTPGSNAGIPISILSSLDAPPFEILDDTELFADRIESTVTSLLSLLGIDADPIQDPEHILLSNIFSSCWLKGENLSLQSLIKNIQEPPFEEIGVLPVDDCISKKDRSSLAMKMNSLLASPGFSVWLNGVPLDINKLMHAPDGRARVSIFSISHLSDSERMFFVSLLLNQMLGWMRAQSGTSSLRALLYMDEIYGYLPPTANPPSKKPLMTMLKQARAFGLGCLLATQNPVDLDYKALSNIGAWFLGRLQTERDKMRVLDGLEGAAASQDSGFNRQRMEETLAGLGSRVFLLNNVHDDAPITFHVRWVMSYLCGPLARTQVKQLMDPKRGEFEVAGLKPAEKKEKISKPTKSPPPAAAEEKIESKSPSNRLPASIKQFYVPVTAEFLGNDIVYMPSVVRAAEVSFSEPKLEVFGDRQFTILNRVWDGEETIEWESVTDLPEGVDFGHFQTQPHQPVEFGGLPQVARKAGTYSTAKREFLDWLYRNQAIEVLKAPAFEMCSQPGESSGEFRGRLAHSAREKRDAAIDAFRSKTAPQMERLQLAMQNAESELAEQTGQASRAKTESLFDLGGKLLGALFGGGRRKVFTKTNIESARSRGSRVMRETGQVSRARAELEGLAEKLQRLEFEIEDTIAGIRDGFDPDRTELETLRIKPLKKNIKVKACGLAWLPFVKRGSRELQKAWL